MINESNYHIYLDDFVAGLLDEELEMEFVAFLDKHPGILEEETLEESSVALEANFRNNLKKEIPLDEQHIDEFIIASMEGDLSAKQEAELQSFLQENPQFEINTKLLQLTKLEADEAVVFENKSSLKKRPVIYLYKRWAASAAAVFILGLMLFRILGNGGVPDQEIAGLPVFTGAPIELPAFTLAFELDKPEQSPKSIQVNEHQKTPNPRVADRPKYANKIPQQLNSQEIEPYALVRTEVNELAPLPLNISAPSIPADIEFASNAKELTVFQWAYKKLRAKVGAPEIVVPEKEIPQDVANIVLAKMAPVFQVSPDGSESRFKIGGVEINRRTARN